MANELRVRSGFLGGLIEDNPLASGATVLTSAGLAAGPAIGATQHQAITLDPDGLSGNPEIAYITAHVAAATTATILRGQEGTTARAHDRDTPWLHGPTVKDFDGSGGGSGVIGLTVYNPGGQATVNTTSSTYGFVDSTNLVVAFVAPPSGKVLGRLCARGSGGGDWLHWGVHDGTSDVSVSDAQVTLTNIRSHHEFQVTGLTPGTTYTWKWRHKNESNSITVSTIYGGASGMAVMEVWAVNL